MRIAAAALSLAVCAGCGGTDGAETPAADGSPPDAVRLTWLSVSNWLVEAGDTRILLDGYVTRIDRTALNADGTSTATAAVDTAALARVVDTVVPDRQLDWILVGHGHWDHAFDVAGWARLTPARIGGARTVCHQVVAQGIEPDRCQAFEGGEAFDIAPGVHVRVVRWHHSGDSLTENGRRLRAPLELRGPPPLDPATGGLRPGFLEDFPNGGGSRGYLITVQTAGGPVTLFSTNTANPEAWDAPVPADSALFREWGVDVSHVEWAASETPTRDHLLAALEAEGLDGVDLWMGYPRTAHVLQVAAVLRPRAFIPHHWDDFWVPMDGVAEPYVDEELAAALAERGIRELVPASYFETFRVDTAGVVSEGDRGIVQRSTR